MAVKITYFVHGTTVDNEKEISSGWYDVGLADFLEFLKQNYNGKSVAIVAHKAPQLALDVLLKNKTWEQAFAEDWRKRKAWQHGWEYILE